MHTQFLQKITQNQAQSSYLAGWYKAIQNFEQILAEEKKHKKTTLKQLNKCK